MPRRRQVKVYITEVNINRRPPLARAREVVSGAPLTISLEINRGQTPQVGEIWWVEYFGTRWALYARVSEEQDNTSGTDNVSSTTLDLFFNVKEEATKLSYYPLVKFNAAKVAENSADVSHYIISWTKCTKNGKAISNEKAQQYTWNPNEAQDGADNFVDVDSSETYDYSVEIPFEIDNPKTSYYKARIRAVSKVNATKGAWSPWTKPKIPRRNSVNTPPQVEDVGLNFAIRETNSGKIDYRAIVRFKDVGYWDIPGYDFEDDVQAYDVQLQAFEKSFKTFGTLSDSINNSDISFTVNETRGSGAPQGLGTPFDIQIGNEIIGILDREGPKASRTYNVAARGKYSTVAVAHPDGAAVKEYDINAYSNYNNLIPVDPEDIPALREIVRNRDESGKIKLDVTDRDSGDTVQSWPRISKLSNDITAAQTSFTTDIINAKLLNNLPKTLSAFSTSPYLFKISIKKEVMGVTDWNYNLNTQTLHLEVERAIDSTNAEGYDSGTKIRINSWLSIGYLQNDMTDESDTITIVEDRILDFDTNNDGFSDSFTIQIENERLQVYSRKLVDTFQSDGKNYYAYEYDVYRGIQNTESSTHLGGTSTPIEIDLGYYYAVTFESIPKPKKFYWKARVRAQDRFNRFGPWSAWTDPVKASEDPNVTAPSPTGVALNFSRKHRNRGWSISARASWDKVNYEIPGGNTEDDVKGYQSRLLSSDGSKLVESIGFDSHTILSRSLTSNVATLTLDLASLTEYSFSVGQSVEILTTTIDTTNDEVYNGTFNILTYDLSEGTITFYKQNDDLETEEVETGTVTTPQTVIKVFEPDKTNSTQRQLGSDGTGYILLTSDDLPEGIASGDATNADYYEMMYVKESWKSTTEDYYEYWVARGVLGTKPRDFATQWMIDDITEPIKPMLIFTYPAAFEATKLVGDNEQELEPVGGIRYSQNFGPVRRQYWYVAQVRTLSTSNLVGPWSKLSPPATALDNVRPPQPFNINVIPYNNYAKVDWNIQSEPGVFVPTIEADPDGELNPEDFEIISSDVAYFKVQLWSEDPHAEAPDEQAAFGLNGDPTYSGGIVTLTTDDVHTFEIGEVVVIKGCWPNKINGEHTVQEADTNSIGIAVNLDTFNKDPYQIDGMIYKKGEAQALDLYRQYPIHFFRRTSINDLKQLRLAEKGDICQISQSGQDNGYYELTKQNYRLLSSWKKIKKEKVQIPGLLFYDRYVNLTSRNVPVKKLTNKVWARVCSVDEAGNQSEWISAGPFNTEFIPGPEWVLTLLKHRQNAQLDAKVKWAEVTSPDFNVGSYNIELQQGRLYAQLYNDSMDFWGLDPTQDIVVGMLSYPITADTTETTLNVTEFGESADAGEYIKIGDEIFKVIDREASDDVSGFVDAVYTVERGSVGTTPIAHNTGALMLKVQSEAILVRELFSPIASADPETNTTFDIVIGNETMKVLERVAYDAQTTTNLTYSSTSPTFNPAGDWTSAGSTGIGTIGSGSSAQSGSSSLLLSTVPGTTDKIWIAVTSTGIWTSSDLLTWDQVDSTTNLRSIGYGNGVWVAVGNNGVILTSTNPTLAWTVLTEDPFNGDDIYSVKYGNETWVISGKNNKIAVTSNPTLTWTLIDPNLDITLDVFDKSISGNIVTLTIARTANISTDSIITVSGLGSPYDGEFTVTSTNNTTVAMTGTTDTFLATEVSYSIATTGSHAAQTALARPPVSIGLMKYSVNINALEYGAGYWAAVCDRGIIITSINPLETWIAAITPTTLQLTSIKYANGIWVAVGNSGIILTAINPSATWTKRESGVNSRLFDVAYGKGRWVVSGGSGVLLTSSNPTTIWTAATTPSNANIYSVYFGATGTPSEWISAGTNGLVLYVADELGTTPGYDLTGNLWVYSVLRDRTWGSNLGQVEDFQHPDLTPIFDTIDERTATRTGAIEADQDKNDYWDYTFTNVPATFFYRSRVQGVLKSGIKGNWSHYTLWANPNDLTPPATPIVDADFDAKVLNVSWTMPDDVTTQIFRVDNFEEVLDLNTAKVGDIAVYLDGSSVYAFRLTALPAEEEANWAPTLSPIDDQGNTIDISNDYLYKTDAAAFYQVQVSRVPKKWDVVGSLGKLLKKLEDGDGLYTLTIDPGQKLKKYPKANAKIKIGDEIMTITNNSSNPTTKEEWWKPKVLLEVNRSSTGNTPHAKGSIVKWVKTNGDEFLDPANPFAYKWLWQDERSVVEMSRSYTADHIKQYKFAVRVRAVDAAGNFSDWSDIEYVSPTGIPTPDITSLEFTDIDNTPDTLEGILTFTGSMDPGENISNFVTELQPTQQMRILNKMTDTSTKVFVRRKNKVLNPSNEANGGIGPYSAYIEEEVVRVTARTPVIFKGITAYKLTVERGYNDENGNPTTATAHDKQEWVQWFHHDTVKQIIQGVPYIPSLDATVDADSGTIISDDPPLGEYKTVFNGIKSGRWYRGRAKAVTEDGLSGSWSDWSIALRGTKGSNYNPGEGQDPIISDPPNPVRNLTLDVDQQKIHVFWVEPKPSYAAGTADSIAISTIKRNGSKDVATVTTTEQHGLSLYSVTLDATGNYIELPSHGLVSGQRIFFTEINTTTGISINTNYYVREVEEDRFKIAVSPSSNSAIDFTNDGSATIFIGRIEISVNLTDSPIAFFDDEIEGGQSDTVSFSNTVDALIGSATVDGNPILISGGYVDLNDHGFTNGQIINFTSIDSNVMNLFLDTDYYVYGAEANRFYLVNSLTTPTIQSIVDFVGSGQATLILGDVEKAVTFTDSGDWVNLVAHGLSNGQKVKFTVINTTTGIIIDTNYYVYNAETDRFQLTATANSTVALTLTANGSGFIRYNDNDFDIDSEQYPAEDVIISGAYAPFNGTFTVSKIISPTKFEIPIEFADDDPTYYPLEGSTADEDGDANNDAVVTLANENENNNESEVDHYKVSIKVAKQVNGVLVPSWEDVQAGDITKGWKTDNNVKTTSKTFKLQSPTKDEPYYARVIAISADGRKSEARYAKNTKLRPPKPTIDSIKIVAAKHGNKYVAKIGLLQNRVVTDKEITKYKVEYFWHKDPNKDPDEVDSMHHKTVPASRIKEGKRIRIGHLPSKKYLFVRIASQNAVGKHSAWTKWRRRKIVLAKKDIG